jgi:hypothetical protein
MAEAWKDRSLIDIWNDEPIVAIDDRVVLRLAPRSARILVAVEP